MLGKFCIYLIYCGFSDYHDAFEELARASFEVVVAGEERQAALRVAALAGALAGLLMSPLPVAASITGVCPDGSIFIVQRAESIPCRDSKQVEPDDVPPLKPEMLPRPYAWEVFNRRNDPNNPYNLIDAGRAVRGESGMSPSGREAGGPARKPVQSLAPRTDTAGSPEYAHSGGALPPVSGRLANQHRAEEFDLALGPDEVRDLALIVEYSQRKAPARLARGGSTSSPALVVRFAQSRSFDARLQVAAQRAGQRVRGPAVLFMAESATDESFYANLTFVQDHVAFHPETAKSDELGLIDGRLGRLTSRDRVLGYVVLPEHMDLSQPMDIYWNDRQLTATLRP